MMLAPALNATAPAGSAGFHVGKYYPRALTHPVYMYVGELPAYVHAAHSLPVSVYCPHAHHVH
jgi:hypothetical protein